MTPRYPLRWTFHLQANRSWIDSFAAQYPGGDVVIISDPWDDAPTNYRWSSPHLNELDDPAALGARAAALKALYDGAMYVYRLGDYHSFPLERPLEYIGLTAQDLELRQPFEPYSEEWTDWRFEAVEDPHLHPVSLYLFLAHYSEVVKHMLIFLGTNGPSWISLYALKDFMQKPGGWKEADMASATGIAIAEIERFRATANNFAAIGPFARHGEVGWSAPKNPMRLAEATTLILTCVRKFMEQEAGRLDTRAKFEARKA